jgi:hypothetical protein
MGEIAVLPHASSQRWLHRRRSFILDGRRLRSVNLDRPSSGIRDRDPAALKFRHGLLDDGGLVRRLDGTRPEALVASFLAHRANGCGGISCT